MAIKVLTGQPRNGKSLRAMKEVYKLVAENDKLEKQGKPRRKIYIDIAGVNGDDTDIYFDDCVTNLTREQKETIWFGKHDDPLKPDHLWCPPYNSIFMFDECHKLDFIKEVSGSLSKNPSTISLNEHGHAGHIIYLITQFPQYIHTHIRGLTEQHWHVKKKFNLPIARIYIWDDFVLNPRAEVNLKNANSQEWLFFLPKYKRAYVSAAAHEKQNFEFPTVLILPILALLFIVGYLYSRKDENMIYQSIAGKEQQVEVQSQQNDDLQQMQEQNELQKQQIDNMRAELEELKQKYLPSHIDELAQYEDVRPAMVITSDLQPCRAYNSYGEPLLLSDGLCRMMDEYPAMIPRSRQEQKVSDNVPKSFNESQQQSTLGQSETDLKYFNTAQYSIS